MDVSAINYGMTSTASTTSSAEGMGKEDFLTLLVAQLANQDPLNPMENTEFVAQLAQYSSLEQLMTANDNLSLLQISQSAMTNSQITDLIGKEVEAKGDRVNLSGNGPVDINFDLPSAASEVSVKIVDANGNTIRTLEAGSRGDGFNSISWDGKDNLGNQMPEGQYKVEVSAKDADGNDLAVSSRFTGVVTGVTYNNGTPLLEMGDSTIQAGDVIAVRQYAPSESSESEEN